MAYNKAKEEKKWRLWKEAEEKKLRSLGVDEDTIEKLRVHDWAVFNSDRRFYQRLKDVATYLEKMEDDEKLPEIKSVDDLLESIENQKLHAVGTGQRLRCLYRKLPDCSALRKALFTTF